MVLFTFTDFIQPVRFGVLSDRVFASQLAINDVKPLLLVRSLEENLVIIVLEYELYYYL